MIGEHGAVELDHIFCFVESENAAEVAVAKLGLVETYRRAHLGQGTANICCAFDNIFVEFLWLTNAEEATSPCIRRMGLLERSKWAQTGNCPFGIAWRGELLPPPQLPTWGYRPPYLPAGAEITVAEESDNHSLPLVFTFPGTTEPRAWPRERRRSLQHVNRMGHVGEIDFTLPPNVGPSPILGWLTEAARPQFSHSRADDYHLRLTIYDLNDIPTAMLELPEMSRSDLRN